ncbi:MAG: hypothetical protein ACRBN8_06920 [Nannocystales bacterium]
MNWKTLLATCLIATLPLGCDSDGDDDHDADTEHHHDTEGDSDESEGHDTEHDHGETELITTVTLTFTSDTADTVTAAFSDPDGDGGMSGSSDPVVLAPDTTYALSVEFTNELEQPAEDITEEVREEAEEHQVFIYGSSVTGPASMGDGLLTHAYTDLESDYTENTVGDDLPVGLVSSITTGAASTETGELEVMLRHLPDVNGNPVKTSDLSAVLAAGDALPGDVDANVHFDVTVQ